MQLKTLNADSDLWLPIHDSLTRQLALVYIGRAQTEHRTLLPRIPPSLSDVLSRLLPSNSLGIVDVEACFAFCETVFLLTVAQEQISFLPAGFTSYIVKLSPYIWPRPCNHCNLARFL
jgi:hypothetical protein